MIETLTPNIHRIEIPLYGNPLKTVNSYVIKTDQRTLIIDTAWNRPDALNALSSPLQAELTEALNVFEADDAIGAIVLTGSKKAFAAGADIKEMQSKTYASVQAEDFISAGWERLTTCRKPVIAAVAGFALGGGPLPYHMENTPSTLLSSRRLTCWEPMTWVAANSSFIPGLKTISLAARRAFCFHSSLSSSPNGDPR